MKEKINLIFGAILLVAIVLLPTKASWGGTSSAVVGGVTWQYETFSADGKICARILGCDSKFGAVSIPSQISGYPVTQIGDYAFYWAHNMSSVSIPSSVTSIGAEAFFSCQALKSLVIPKSVTRIGAGAFGDCSHLTSITLPFIGAQRGGAGDGSGNGGSTVFGYIFGKTTLQGATETKQNFAPAYQVTYYIPSSLKSVVITDDSKIAYGAFSGCAWLESITIPSTVTRIEDMAFAGCSRMMSVAIPSSVTHIGSAAFCDCLGLSSVTIPSSVTSIGSGAFEGCSGLTSVSISPEVMAMAGGLFKRCVGLADSDGFVIVGTILYDYLGEDAEVNIPDGVLVISDSAFSYRTRLTSVTIPEGVKNIGSYAFYCTCLTTVRFPSSVTDIGDWAFGGCDKMTSVKFSEGVTSIGIGAFSGCSGLDAVYIDNLSVWCGVVFRGNPFSCAHKLFVKGKEVVDLQIPEGVRNVGQNAFSGCSELMTVTIPEGVTNIGACAFSGCSGMTSVMIPDSVASIGQSAFVGCNELTSIVLPFIGSRRGNSGADSLFGYIFGTESYSGATATRQYYSGSSYVIYYIPTALKTVLVTDETEVGYGAFDNCSGLTSVTLSSSVMCIGAYAFENCNALTSIMIPEGVTHVGTEAFGGCSGLKYVAIPSSVTSIGDGAFSGCSGLTSVAIPEGVSSVGRYMFSGCSGLISVNIPESVASIGLSAFSRCSGLVSVTLPSSVTSIGNNAFQGCSGLTSMVIPDGVTSIGTYAFSGCRGMSTIMIPSSVTSIGTYAFQNCSTLSLVVTDDGDVDRVKGMMKEAEIDVSKIAFCEKNIFLPVFVPESGTVFDAALKVSITNRVADAVVHYTVDGSEPTLDSPVFKKFTVIAKTTVKAIAEWCGIVSDVATAIYGKGRAAQPVISAEHVEDFHFSGNVVSISCATDGVEIHYTTSGEEPTATSPLYAEPFVVDDTVMIKAIAIGHVDYLDSDVAELSLVRTRLTVATPEISTWKGDESGGERTTELVGSFLWTKIECATENATIHYTTDGSEPTVASAVYERPFRVTDSAVITAVAFKDEWNDSLSASVRVTKRWKEGDSLNVPDMRFDGDGAAVWETDRTVSYDGVASMRSGDVGDGQYSALRTVVNGPGTVTFKWKASCEATDVPPYWWDYGSFSVDGEEVAWIDGETDWRDCEISILGAGDHVISWKYTKDDSGKDGDDYIWVDMFSWQPSFSLVIEGDESATVTGDAGSGQVGISAPIGSVWEAIATEPWIKVITPTGSGSGTVTYQFAENLTGKVRTGKIIISGEEYTINQMYRVVMSVGVEGRGGVTGAGTYDYGADVMLTATPDADYSFSHWSGAANGTDNPVTIRIDEACKATAHFIPFVPTATATANELDGVTISWGALAWAEQYRVCRAEANQKPESSVATIAKGTLTWKDTTAAPGKTYYYWVEAVGSKEQTTSAAVTGMRAVSPTGLAISCVSSLFAGQTANCGCTVSYNNGTTKDVTPTWSVVGSGLTVDASSVLSAGTVANDTIATVQASYTESGITKTASAQVTVYPAFDVNDAASGVGTLSTGGSGAWIGQKKESCGGAVALRSTGLASGASAWIGCSVTGAGTLTFKWRKSGSGSGKLALAVNGSESAVCGEASDTWATVTKEFYDNGTKNIRWTYFGGSNVDAHGLVAEIVWTPGAAITVNFDANGGAGTMEGMTFFEGADVALTSNAFTRTGYVFAGWATSEDGEVAYLDGAAVWGMTASVGGVVTLYAVWTPNAYTVRFAANGGEGTMADEPMTYDVEKALTANVFARKGYTFAGWATSAGGAVKYANGATVKNLTATACGTVTLYAKWTPNNYVIDFNPGQGGTGTMSDQPMIYDEEAALYANLFARMGYTFLGWTDDEGELEEVLYYDGVVVSNLTDEVDGEYDLYAVWAANEYTVRFNANGGEGTMSDQAFLYDEEQNLYLNCFTRVGHSFAGWARSAKGAVAFEDGGSASNLTAEADGLVTLYAQWSANPYTVKFDANGGEGEMSDMDCTYGVLKQLTFNAFTRVGYTFAGWATSAKGEVAYANGAAIKSIAASGVVTLYAKWTAISYSVKFNANGGSGSMANGSMAYDAAKALTACAFAKTGYTFAGWATSAGGSVVYANGQTVKNLTATQGAVINLYAKWTVNGYTIAFNANGGTGSMANESMTYDVEKALTACAFTRTGYTFAGWATSAGGTVGYADGATVKNLMATAGGTVTLYAKWTPNNYVIDFNPGQGGEGSMPDQSMTYDEAEALYPNLFHRTGYTFLGWTDDPNEVEEVLYYDGVVVENLTDEVDGEFDLYAVWAANEYTVRFNANGGSGTMAGQAFAYDAAQNLTMNGFTRAGCEFLGWAMSSAGEVVYADGASVKNLTATADGVVNLYAVWNVTGLVDPAETHIDVAQGEVAPYAVAATVYDGYLYDGDKVVGSVQVKVAKGKTDKKSGAFSAKVTATVQLTGDSKKVSFKGGVADGSGRVTGLTAAGHTLDISLGVDGMGGTMDGKSVDGARNLFSAKDADSKSIAAAIEKKWVGAVNVVGDDIVLSVAIAKKGKVKVSGTVEGAKVSATSQLLAGAEACCVPVVITKKANLAFNLWLMADGSVEVVGLDGAVAGKAEGLKAGAAFRMDGAAGVRALPGLYGEYLPNGVGVAQSGTKWVVAGGAKAGKLALVKGTSEIDSAKSKFTDNMSGLKLTYKAKDGSFKGSFKVYSLENGKIKAYTANVTGVMIGNTGYGTATVKKFGSVAVTIE